MRSYAAAESVINLVPPELGGRYKENLFFKTLSLWSKIFFVFAATLLFAMASTLFILLNQHKALSEENISLNSSLQQKITLDEQLIKDAEYFNQLVNNIKKTKSFQIKTGEKLKIIDSQLKAAGLTFTNAGSFMAGEVIINFNAPNRQVVLEFEQALKNSKAFSLINIPVSQLTPEENLAINLTVK